jgi:transcriptional regulator with XRE-family HTH domain
MRHVNIIGPQVRRLRNQRGWSQDDLAIKLQRAGMEDATRSNVSKLEARLIRAIDEDMLYLARALRVELGELYPESVRLALDLYEAIRRSKASRYGILFFATLISCSQMGAGALDLVTRMGA